MLITPDRSEYRPPSAASTSGVAKRKVENKSEILRSCFIEESTLYFVLWALFAAAPWPAHPRIEEMRLVLAKALEPKHAVFLLQIETEASAGKSAAANAASRKASLGPFERIADCPRYFLDHCLLQCLHLCCRPLGRFVCQPYRAQIGSKLRQYSKCCPRSSLTTG